MKLRKGFLSDLKEIRRLNEQAVRVGCIDFYSPEIIDQWTGPFLDWYYAEAFPDHVQHGILRVIEAERSLAAVGMAFADELYFLFVDPKYFAQGLGSGLLNALEKEVVSEFQTKEFNVLSVKNAVPFYSKNGYQIIGEDRIDVRNNLSVDEIKVRKFL